MRITLVDYGLGNTFSVKSAFVHLGHKITSITDGNSELKTDLLVLPGVAAFGAGMRNLSLRGQDELIREWVSDGKPLLGLCLGAQLLLESSTESPGVAGFGFIEGEAKHLGKRAIQVPHQGWSRVDFEGNRKGSRDANQSTFFFFSHSYELQPTASEDVFCTAIVGGQRIVAGIQTGSLTGLQFHPERSGPDGIRLLDEIVRRYSNLV